MATPDQLDGRKAARVQLGDAPAGVFIPAHMADAFVHNLKRYRDADTMCGPTDKLILTALIDALELAEDAPVLDVRKGMGHYDDIAVALLTLLDAEALLVAVVNGTKGSGISAPMKNLGARLALTDIVELHLVPQMKAENEALEKAAKR